MDNPLDSEQFFCTQIAPVANDTVRPLWSVMVPTYNCADTLAQTLTSILQQDLGQESMQIQVVDDCSTADDPESVVRKLGGGRVEFYRQTDNVGVTHNLTTCIERARGHLIHILHGDDAVLPGFYTQMQHAFVCAPEIGAAFCRQIFMDTDGHWQSISMLEQQKSGVLDNHLERLAAEQCIMTPSIVVRRDVYETLGSFNHQLTSSEDWEMWVRIASQYPFWYEVKPLALYRMHTSSNTERHQRTGKDVRDIVRVIELFRSYLPAERADSVIKQARITYAKSALNNAQQYYLEGAISTAYIQVREALKCSCAISVLFHLLFLFISGLKKQLHIGTV